MPISVQGNVTDPHGSVCNISSTAVTFSNCVVSFTKDPDNPDDEGGKIVDLILAAYEKMLGSAIVIDMPSAVPSR